MERWVAKVIALFIILVVIFFFTVLPIAVAGAFHRYGKTGQRALSILNCFGGGVFFGAYLIFMTPEVRDILNETLLIPNNITYPLPEFFIGLGFFILMFVEKGVLSLSNIQGNTHIVPIEPNEKTSRPIDNVLRIHVDAENSVSVKDKELEMAVINNGTMHTTPDDSTIINDEPIDTVQQAEPPHQGHSHRLDQSAGPLKTMLLLIGLSLDCVFEGMTLGLQRTTRGVWNMVFAILSHEFVIAFTLGLQLVNYNSPKKVFILSVVYGLTAPIGIAIGTAIYETGGGNNTVDILSGVFQALSGGVFIYCTFLQILATEITHDSPFSNIVAVLFGYGLMCGLAAIPQGDDSDNNIVNGTHFGQPPPITYFWPRYLA